MFIRAASQSALFAWVCLKLRYLLICMFRSLVSCYFHRDFVCSCCLSFSTNFFLSRALCVCTCTCCNLCNLFSCTLITLNLTKRIERQFSHGVDEKKAPSCVYCMCMQTFSTQHTYLSFSSFNEFFSFFHVFVRLIGLTQSNIMIIVRRYISVPHSTHN